MKFDVGILGSQPVATIVKQAQLAESLGYDTVWITDTHLICRELWVTLTACALATARVRLGPGITVPQTDFADVTPFLYYVRVEAGRRDAFRQHLAERGIDTGIHWQPGHWFTLFKDCRRGDLSVTERVGREIVSLPLHSKMAATDLDRVCDAVLAFFAVRA